MRKKILWSLFASFLFIGTALAQNLTINGKVTDEKGDPISGASVQVKGTRTGTTVNTLFGSTATSLQTQLIITGRDSGARLTIPVTVTQVS